MNGFSACNRPIEAAAFAAALGLAMAVAPARARAESEPVNVTTQADRGSGRLMLQWRRPVRYTVERAAPFVFLRFSRPFRADLEPARKALDRYLVELRVAGGGRVLVL
ncbi:MAG: hypothetical protein KIT16_22135, partial [Rhodospirillaceae bacterium]|nr:hypothetical protein [Rhodospirillaceae bacterium]